MTLLYGSGGGGGIGGLVAIQAFHLIKSGRVSRVVLGSSVSGKPGGGVAYSSPRLASTWPVSWARKSDDPALTAAMAVLNNPPEPPSRGQLTTTHGSTHLR